MSQLVGFRRSAMFADAQIERILLYQHHCAWYGRSVLTARPTGLQEAGNP